MDLILGHRGTTLVHASVTQIHWNSPKHPTFAFVVALIFQGHFGVICTDSGTKDASW